MTLFALGARSDAFGGALRDALLGALSERLAAKVDEARWASTGKEVKVKEN